MLEKKNSYQKLFVGRKARSHITFQYLANGSTKTLVFQFGFLLFVILFLFLLTFRLFGWLL